MVPMACSWSRRRRMVSRPGTAESHASVYRFCCSVHSRTAGSSPFSSQRYGSATVSPCRVSTASPADVGGYAGSVTQTDPEIARGSDGVAVERHELGPSNHRLERDAGDVLTVEPDHRAVGALGDCPDGGGARAGREQPVVGGRCAAALQMTQHEGPGLLAGM